MILNHDYTLFSKGYSNSIESTTSPRHRWYLYKEGFSPSLVQHAVESCDFDKQTDIILDPFNGSGTVTLSSSLSGHKSIGFEVNPFSCFISKVKQSTLEKKAITSFSTEKNRLIEEMSRGANSPLLTFSTFSEYGNNEKWLFNSDVLRSFQGGIQYLTSLKNKQLRDIFKLAMIKSAMENCNAKKDGKCLRYKNNWKFLNYDSKSFISTFDEVISVYFEDLINSEIKTKANINLLDARRISRNESGFKLCITSPPYLNSFDYSDIYRPELFLGEFLKDQTGFQNLKHQTLRSHMSINHTKRLDQDFGKIYKSTMLDLENSKNFLWSPKIPSMITSYFEDLGNIMRRLNIIAKKNAQLWIVVANSAYVDVEIPTDLIIAEVGTKCGWYLKEIGVLGYLHKRGTKYSPNIKSLRESVVIFSKEKF